MCQTFVSSHKVHTFRHVTIEVNSTCAKHTRNLCCRLLVKEGLLQKIRNGIFLTVGSKAYYGRWLGCTCMHEVQAAWSTKLVAQKNL